MSNLLYAHKSRHSCKFRRYGVFDSVASVLLVYGIFSRQFDAQGEYYVKCYVVLTCITLYVILNYMIIEEEKCQVGGEWIRIIEEMLENLKNRRDVIEGGIIKLEKRLTEDKIKYAKLRREG